MVTNIITVRAGHVFLLLSHKTALVVLEKVEHRRARIREDVVSGDGKDIDEAVEELALAIHEFPRNLVGHLRVLLHEARHVDNDGLGAVGLGRRILVTACVVLCTVTKVDAGNVEVGFGLGKDRC